MKRVPENSQCYAFKLCAFLFLGIFIFNTALNAQTLCYVTPSTAVELNQCNENIARTFAPILMQSVSTNSDFSVSGNADRIAAVNFDGNWNTSDNWENTFLTAPLGSALPMAYYHVIWTNEFWIITYTFHYPRDYGNGNLGCPNKENHEGDAERVLIVVKRPESSSTDAGDLKVGVITTRHGSGYGLSCVNDLTAIADSDPFIGGGSTHTIVGSAPGSHALFNNSTKAYPKEDKDGLNWGQRYCRPDAESRIRYSPGTVAVKNAIPSSGISNERYTLEDVTIPGGLWDRRCNTTTFPVWGRLGCDNYSCDNGAKASAPWNGEIGSDPIAYLEDFFDGNPFSVDCDCRSDICEGGNGSAEVDDNYYRFNPYACDDSSDCGESSFSITTFPTFCMDQGRILLASELSYPYSTVSWDLPPGLIQNPSLPLDPPNSIRVDFAPGATIGNYLITAYENRAPCYPKSTQSIFMSPLPGPTPPVVGDLPDGASSTFNFGEEEVVMIPSMDVNDGGFLRVNDLGPTRYLNGPNTTMSTFEAEISDCNGATNVNINDGGAFILGSDPEDSSRKATVYVRTGSTVHVKSGGKLRLTRGSQLIVEEGATLIIDEGARVDLWWSESTIRVKGELVVNGEFEFSGSGFFQFDPTNVLTLTDEFKLRGQNVDHRFIRINGGSLNIGSHSLHLSYGTVEYRDDSQIEVGEGGRLYAYRVNFKSMVPLSGSIGLSLQDPSYVHVAICKFDDFYTGISSNDFYSVDHFKILNATFTKNTFGIWGDGGDEMIIQNSVFDQGLYGIQLSNINKLSLQSSRINSEDLPGLTTVGLDLNNVTDAYVSSTTFSNNTNSVRLNDVFSYSMVGGRIEHPTSYDNASTIGILAPASTAINDNNETNIYLSSKAIIQNQQVGIRVEKGGPIDGTNEVFGLVSMDCAKLINNKSGIEGIDVSLEIDALVHCGCNSVDDASPNTFIKSSGPQGGWATFFNICYSDLTVTTVSAQGNFWSGGDQSTTGNCDGGGAAILANDIQSPSEPTRCGPIVIEPPREVKGVGRADEKVDDLDRNKTMEVFPNPTDGKFTIALGQEVFRLRIYNSLGKIVLEDPSVQGSLHLNLDNLPKGVYFVEALHPSTEKKFQEKLIVQ